MFRTIGSCKSKQLQSLTFLHVERKRNKKGKRLKNDTKITSNEDFPLKIIK